MQQPKCLMRTSCGAVSHAACSAAGAAAAQQQQQVPQCTWFSYDPKVPVAGYCTLDDRFLLSSSLQEPSNFISKQLTRIYGRQHLCSSAASSKAACEAYEAKQKLGCYWSDSINICQAREFTDWKWFSRHAYASETPASFMCPGSRGARYKTCFGLPKGADCTATKGCVPAKAGGSCEPDFWAGLGAANQTVWQGHFDSASPFAMGECEATCYLQGLYSRKTGVYGGGAWGQAVEAAGKVCSGLSKDSFTCQAGPKAGVVATARLDKYKNYVVENVVAKSPSSSFSCP